MKINPRLNYHPDVKIQEIINSFYNYAIRDIRVNIENPIAAFILASCFIDQMTAFRYDPPKGKGGEFYKKFIEVYMPHLVPLDLYTNLRCNMVHGYSLSGSLALSHEPNPADTIGHISINNLNVPDFLKELTIAFGVFAYDIRNNAEARNIALIRYDKWPPIIGVNRGSLIYDEPEATFLENYFTNTKSIIGEPINGDEKSNCLITSVKKIPNNGRFVVKCIWQDGAATYETNLDEVTQQLGVEYPLQVLRDAGLL